MLPIFLILFLFCEIHTSYVQIEIFKGNTNCDPSSYVYEGGFQTDKDMRHSFSNTTFLFHFQCNVEKKTFNLFFCQSMDCDIDIGHTAIGDLYNDSSKCFEIDGLFEIKIKNCSDDADIPYFDEIETLKIGSEYKVLELAYLNQPPTTCSPDLEFFDFDYIKYFSSNTPTNEFIGDDIYYYCDPEVLIYSIIDAFTNLVTMVFRIPWIDGTCIRNPGVSFLRTEVVGTMENFKRDEKFDVFSLRKFCHVLSNNEKSSSSIASSKKNTTLLNYETFKEIDRFGLHRLYSGYTDPFLLNYVYWDSECSTFYTYVVYVPTKSCRSGGVDIYHKKFQQVFVNSTYNLYTTHSNDSTCENEVLQISARKMDSLANCFDYYVGGTQLFIKNTVGDMETLQKHTENDLALFFSREDIPKPDFKEYPPIDQRFFINNDLCMNKDRQFLQYDDQSMKGHCENGNPIMRHYDIVDTCENVYWTSKTDIIIQAATDGVLQDFFCVNYTCFGTNYLDRNEVCSGHGDCIGYNNCSCKDYANRKYSGPRCSKEDIIESNVDVPDADYQWIFWTATLGTLFLVVLGVLCFCSVLVYLVLFFVFCGVVVFICFPLFCVGCVCVLTQYRRIRKYKKLKDFDIYLNEQLLEKEHNIAHFNINKKLFEIKYEDLKLLEIIGSGGSGSNVYKCEFKGTIVAFKRFRSKDIFNSEENFKEFEKELSIISSVSHRNILHFYGCCLTPPSIGIIMEYCPHGDVKDYLKKNENFNIKEKIRLFIEISCALDLLHSKSIIHRDLKCENVLLDDSLVCKVMDFGISKIVDLDSNNSITKGIGTCFYMSPEITRGSVYDIKVDVYSFGIMIWEICCQNFKPYGEKDIAGIEYKVSNDPLFRPDLKKMEENGVPESLQDLAQRCWDNDPSVRPSFEKIRVFLEEEVSFIDSSSEINLTNVSKKEENEEIILYIKKIEEDDDDSEDISISVPITIEKLKEIAKQKWGDFLISKEISFFGLNSENRKYDKLISNDNDCENFLKNNDVVAVKILEE